MANTTRWQAGKKLTGTAGAVASVAVISHRQRGRSHFTPVASSQINKRQLSATLVEPFHHYSAVSLYLLFFPSRASIITQNAYRTVHPTLFTHSVSIFFSFSSLLLPPPTPHPSHLHPLTRHHTLTTPLQQYKHTFCTSVLVLLRSHEESALLRFASVDSKLHFSSSSIVHSWCTFTATYQIQTDRR